MDNYSDRFDWKFVAYWYGYCIYIYIYIYIFEVEVTLRLTVSQSVCFRIECPSGTYDQILFPFGMLLYEICGIVSVGRPLWREDGSAICSVITQWSESLRTGNHILLSHLRLRQSGGPGSRIYIAQEQGGPIIPPGTGIPLRRLLRLAGLRWRYSNPSLTWCIYIYIYIYLSREERSVDGPTKERVLYTT
jgi:hypothetical protein